MKREINTRTFIRATIAALASLVSLLALNCYAEGNPLVNSQPGDTSKFNDYVKTLGRRAILADEDARTYASDLDSLVGFYFWLDNDNTINLIARPDNIQKATLIQLKDKIEFQSTTEDGGSLSTTLPWLSFLFKTDDKTSVLIQDLATVIGTSDPNTIKTNFPRGMAPDGKEVWFITGATVTLVSATLYSDKSFNGSTIIQVGGNALYTQNTLQNAWVISINKVRASGGVGALSDPLAGKIIRIKKPTKISER